MQTSCVQRKNNKRDHCDKATLVNVVALSIWKSVEEMQFAPFGRYLQVIVKSATP